jgi:uncharacterized protein
MLRSAIAAVSADPIGLDGHASWLSDLRPLRRPRQLLLALSNLLKLRPPATTTAANPTTATHQTLAAMESGADAIAQATLTSNHWPGRADVLLRVDAPSNLGNWSYEVVDTKLARETRAGTILQLSLYTDIVGELQGKLPEQMHVVAPGRDFEPESHRVLDYAAYYRHVRRRLEDAVVEVGGEDNEPCQREPFGQCDI